MKRRTFLQPSLVALSSTAAVSAADSSSRAAPGELYELRVDTLKAARRPVPDDYLSKAFLPALKRQGIDPVGYRAWLDTLPEFNT